MTGSEVRAMKDEEIKITLGKLRQELLDIRTKQVTDTVSDTTRPGKVRKDIARMLGEQHNRARKGAKK
jgi:ribosomal protein L29